MKKRDISVDFIKFIACLMVIMAHCTYASVFPEGVLTLHRLYLHLFPLCNGLFFFMTGFYLFQNESPFPLWKKTIRKVVLPGFLTLTLWHYFYDYVINGIPFSESHVFSLRGTLSFLLSVFTLKETEVYWYLSAYIWVILAYPVLKGFVDYLAVEPKREQRFLLLSFALLIFNDIAQNRLFDFGFSGIGILLPSALFVIWGHLFRKNLFRIQNQRAVWIAALLFVLCMALRFPLDPIYERTGLSGYVTYWFNSPGLICTICLCIIGCNLFQKKTSYPTAEKLLPFVNRYTFPIYLLHPIYIRIAWRYGWFSRLYELLYVNGHGIIYSVILILITCLFFSITALITAVILQKAADVLFSLPPKARNRSVSEGK